MSDSAVYTAPKQPDASSSFAAKRADLTAEQQGKLDAVIQHLNTPGFKVPNTVKDARNAQKQRLKQSKDPKNWLGKPLDLGVSSTAPLTDAEKCYLTNEQCQRFLRAQKWELAAAIARCEETIAWRREFDVDGLTEQPEIVSVEGETGKEFVMGWDIHKRPCLYMFPARQNTKTSHAQIQHVVWTLERTVDLMPPGVENLCLLIDMGSVQPAPLGQSKKVLEILQTYYCERLGRAICINVPTIFWGFYRLVSPFVDPVTKDKIRFNPDVRTLVPPGQLEKANFKGDSAFIYKHEQYFPDIIEATNKKREEIFARWQEFGNGQCGVSEFLIKGGEEQTTSQGQPQLKTPVSAAMSHANGANLSGPGSPAQSVRSEGYKEPPEAASAPDYVEPSPTSSVATSSVATSSPSMPSTPSKLGGQNGTLTDSLDQTSNRPRADSADSFVTTREGPTSSLSAFKNARDDDALELAPGGGATQDHVGLETGVKNLVVKDDGSIGLA